MHNAIPLILAALLAVGIMVIGCFYLASPERISGTFGLKPPASDADTLAWLRPKGIRDVASGLLVLTLMLTADRRLVGIAVLVYAIIPFGDMSIILGSGGSKSRAFSVHGLTCAVMLVVGLLLIHAIPEGNAPYRSMAREGWEADRALGRMQSAGIIHENRRGDG